LIEPIGSDSSGQRNVQYNEFEDNEGNTPLMSTPSKPDVVGGKNIPLEKLLLERRANVNAKNKYDGTPLLAAIGSIETVKAFQPHLDALPAAC
jgi:ankyrin repeat protein